MKSKFYFLFTFLVFFGANGLIGQNEESNEINKVVIVTKTTDKDGNVTVEKKVAEGDDAKDLLKEMNGEDVKNVNINKDKNGQIEIEVEVESEEVTGTTKEVSITVDATGNVKQDIEVEESNVNGNKKVKIVTFDSSTGEEKVVEWEGKGEIPAEIKEEMEKHEQSEKGTKKMMIRKEMKQDGAEKEIRINKRHQKANGQGTAEHNYHVVTDTIVTFNPETYEETIQIVTTKVPHEAHEKDNGNKAYLGVMIENVEGGAKVTGFAEDSPAKRAGLLEGDVIYKVNKERVNSVEGLIDALKPYKPGDNVKVKFFRGGAKKSVKVGLKKKPDYEVGFEIERRSCNRNFSGDEDIDFMFNSIIEEDNSNEVIVIVRDIVEDEIEVNVQQVEIEKEVELREIDPNALSINNFNVFPNPSKGRINLSFEAGKGPLAIKIVDVAGKLIYKEELINFEGSYAKDIDLTNAAKGNVMINIVQNGRLFSKGMLIQ